MLQNRPPKKWILKVPYVISGTNERKCRTEMIKPQLK